MHLIYCLLKIDIENLDDRIQRVNKKLYTGIDVQVIHILNLEALTFQMTYYTTGDLSDLTSEVQIYIELFKEWYCLACNYDPVEQRIKG